jgi:bifunctional DNA-binding transcriptional regulator/antitoxin component of YhaV-PrlF toxin-antitoxin module
MRFQCFLCLLAASLAFGQAAPPTPAQTAAPSAAPASPAVTVGPDDVVITIKGFCTDSSLTGDACKTAVTRAQFEKLADALQPGMSPAIKRQLASGYSRMLRMSADADKRGLDKEPKFDEQMRFARMQILSQSLNRALQEESGKVSDEDIADYYNKNQASYVQATFARIFIPRAKQIKPPANASTKPGAGPAAPPAPTQEQQKEAEEAMTTVAKDIQARAVKGEDPDKLQKEAYADAGLPGNAPTTKMEKVRRTTLPQTHQRVMDLKPGEVSELITDANSGHYVYKMISVETLTLETVKPEIKNQLSSQRYREDMQAYQGNIDLNDSYFGAVKAPGTLGGPRGVKPPQEDQDPD